MRINNINSDFNDVISGVLQGSVADPILFNAFFNDFFFMQHVTFQNFTDGNTLSGFVKTFDKLKEILESESEH